MFPPIRGEGFEMLFENTRKGRNEWRKLESAIPSDPVKIFILLGYLLLRKRGAYKSPYGVVKKYDTLRPHASKEP